MSIGVSTARADSSNCPAGNLCLWFDAGFQGTQWDFNEHNSGANQWVALNNAYDNADSLYNNRVNKSLVGTNVNPVPNNRTCVNPGGLWADLAKHTYPGGIRLAYAIGAIDLIDPDPTC
jgi:hypothetical protein